jgi:hypothetical protein
VFLVIKLLKAPEDPIIGRRPKPPPPLTLIDREQEYEVEAILNSHVFCKHFEYLVK